jgi:glycosyltransferase involved in cell wall biosynthesis
VPDVFDDMRAHVASLHGMIEHGEAFGATAEQLREADRRVTTWVYTAEKNLAPFKEAGLYEAESPRFVKIPNGMQPPKIVPVPRSDMAIPDEAFVLCCVSRAIPDKGWAETMEVVARARVMSGCDIHLVLVGNGPVYEEHCRSGVSPFVHLAGFSDNSVGHYAAADMGIMLTKFKSESFPLTVVDCLFAGKPFIASDVGDIRNMLTTPQGVAGGLVELVDWAIPIDESARLVAAFATDRELYEGAAAHVREAAARFRMDTVAEHYIDLFQSGGWRTAHRTGAPRVSAA